ncbi:MAG TPA: mechanosensitive ion channel domain-containing protein [Verrucomicrobiae bacterium]|nr:mechanosensitive ion channel domain-containing protein [Verrucomicrobiae bacterium]
METNLLKLEKLPEHSANYVAIQIAVIVCLAILAHFLVRLLRFVSDWLIRKSAAKKSPVGFVTQQPKFITLTGLITSAFTLIIYSVGLAFILNVLGMPTNKFIATYLATASVVGFAVGFGSQGLVQDVITGLTLIFTDTLEVGDMVEISGYIGRVETVGLRFTEVRNFYNQQVFLSNRNISNIARFPRGGVYAYVDVRIPEKAEHDKIIDLIGSVAKGMWEQFQAIILNEPELSDVFRAKPTEREFIRIQFKIWPGQGALIENTFRQRLVEALKQMDPNYADWMIVITYRAIDKTGKSSFSI